MKGTREKLLAVAFVLPACALIGLFVLWPAAVMTYTSFHRRGLTEPVIGAACGVENFVAAWSDPAFGEAARNTALFAVVVVPAQTVLALLLAMWTAGGGWSRRVLRWAVFVPTAISLTVLSVLWKLLYEPVGAAGGGLINGLLVSWGFSHQPFLTSPAQALYCLAAMSVWQGVGFQMMIFLAGLQTIPGQLYEAAALDGARGWSRFWHVTLPGVAPTVVLVVMVTTIFALKLFVQPYVMTGGGPRGATRSLVQYIYEAAFVGRDLGLAYAAGVMFFVAVSVLAVGQWWATRRVEARA